MIAAGAEFLLGRGRPCVLSHFRNAMQRGTVCKANRDGDIGSPCWVPRETGKGAVTIPLMIRLVVLELYIFFIACWNLWPNFIVRRTSVRNGH